MADQHLAGMRAKLAAMTQAAEVSAMQTALATTVRERMEKIDSIMGEPRSTSAVDDEVEEWKRKIELLSKPVVSGAAAGAGASLLQQVPAASASSKGHGSSHETHRDEVCSPGSQEIHRLVDDEKPLAEALDGLEGRGVRAVWCCCT